MPKVVIDGVEYVPKVDVKMPTDEAMNQCLRELTCIQYFNSETHKHRAWAWDALNAIAPDIAVLCSLDAGAAFYLTHPEQVAEIESNDV